MIRINKKLWFLQISHRIFVFIIGNTLSCSLSRENSSLYQDNYVNDTSIALSMHFGIKRKEGKRNAGVWCGLYVLWEETAPKLFYSFEIDTVSELFYSQYSFWLFTHDLLVPTGLLLLCNSAQFLFFVLNRGVYECKMQSF